ncbi:ligase-associated DNA damage response endonuclease PdeM [Chitinophaga horti]|uniref:Ligase-associated DNA damage response endonuclease PdeM n=1 Tax=Chitinophaga horti TaxID=2920382 RepID=A0ABY6IWT3_9BACT|nr:ligase-associated DNA damage response endonuclease PdeM [Chitinophaga horti]UYQ91842.1 ligase-associated DNA damage response endonuclease PdeM [Chitinophaga horti]
MEDISFHFREQHWRVSSGKGLYWEEERALIVSDLHLGKSAHFRKAGIAIPANIVQEDLFCLQKLVVHYNPQKVIIVGDMFHSSVNNEVQYFKIWRRQFSQLQFDLITGNHDIMDEQVYDELEICRYDSLTLGNIHFVHDAADADAAGKYVLSGHIHPGVRMFGYGRQSMRLACFYFGREYAVLPAFSHFTGMYMVDPQPGDPVFVLADKKVFKMQ